MKGFDEVEFEKIVVTKKRSRISKFLAYLKLLIEVFYKCNFKSNEYDIIYVHYLNHTLLPFFFVRMKNLPPFILNAHGSDVFPERPTSKLLSFISSKIIKYATKVVVPSKYFKRQVSKKYDIKPQKIFVSPSGGVDFERFKPVKTHESTLVIGFLSRIDPGKRWDLVVEAAKQLNNREISFRVLIGGGGSQEDEMKELIRNLNLEKQIEILGYIPRERVPNFFNEVNLFVFPSERKGESLGLVNLEALASGVPVIGYENGALNEFITDGFNGFLYAENESDILAEKIMQYNNLPQEEKTKLSSNARESVKEYSYEYISKELFQMLKEYV